MKSTLTGIGVSSGIAIAKAKLVLERNYDIKSEATCDAGTEQKRLDEAISKAVARLTEITDKSQGKLEADALQILNTHMAMLKDHNLKKMINSRLQKGSSAEAAVRSSIDELKAIFGGLENEYKRERAADFEDIGKRLLDALSGFEDDQIASLSCECILVAKDLTPSDTAQLNLSYVKAFLTAMGGRTSHSAIMAKSLGLPAVVAAGEGAAAIKDGDILIVDGSTGEIFIDPDEELLKYYRSKIEESKAEMEQLKAYTGKEAVTLDGKKISVECNIGTLKEVEAVLENGTDGIGLFRTEFLFMDRETPPSEEEQFEVYKSVAVKLAGKPVVIRTLDIGGDKEVPCLDIGKEMNPFLGNRAIRLCLEKVDIFKVQLKAILRASKYGKIKLMFPMISGLGELHRAKAVLQEAGNELEGAFVEYDKSIEVGVMIEVPSAAIISDLIAKEVDFFSIGTNDLIQYTLAVDRINEKVAHYYDPLHPAVIRLIELICRNAGYRGIPVGMCGEMAGEPAHIPLIVGLGVEKLSMSASSVLKAKRLISNISIKEARELAEKALCLKEP